MKAFWWAREALGGRPLIKSIYSDVSIIYLINCVINDVNYDCGWLKLFLDNGDLFLMT